MIVGPVRRFETPEGSILVTVDAADFKYLLWGCYERVTLEQLMQMGIDLNRAEETVELRVGIEPRGIVPPAKR